MSEWIDVQQGLPEREGRYLIRYVQHGQTGTFIGDIYYESGEFRWACLLEAEVTYWCEIPAPPEAKAAPEEMFKESR